MLEIKIYILAGLNKSLASETIRKLALIVL
jgi:hypothetical protein